MMMNKYLFTAFIVAIFSLLPDYTVARAKHPKLQNCLGLLRGQERYCCNYIQARTPKKTITITSISTSAVPAPTVTATSTSLTTNTLYGTNTNYIRITTTIPTTTYSTETDTVTDTITVTTYPPLPQQKRRRDSNKLISKEELEKRGWLDSQLKTFGQEIVFDACTVLLQLSHYNCPALPPVTSTIKVNTITTLPAITETDTITSTVDITKATIDVTETITSTQSTTVFETTTTTVQATQSVIGQVSDICNLNGGQCGRGCNTDHDTNGKVICSHAVEKHSPITQCTSNANCPSGSYCGVGSSCSFQNRRQSDPFICVYTLLACSNSRKRENASYDTDTRTGKIIRASTFKNSSKHSRS